MTRGDVAIQSDRSGPSFLDRFAYARDNDLGSIKSHHALESTNRRPLRCGGASRKRGS